MRKFLTCFLAMVLIIGLTTSMVYAKEVILEVAISDMTESLDKNGNTYVRFIAQMDRKLQGVEYQTGIPIMVFGNTLVEKALTYKVGDTLKCIAKYREYQGRESYTVLAFQ